MYIFPSVVAAVHRSNPELANVEYLQIHIVIVVLLHVILIFI